MTKNQIDYFKAKEEARHNLASEKETYRSNVRREEETQRSNLAVERETNRHNIVTEGLSSQANLINMQHYERMDENTRQRNLIDQAHYERMDTESKRHNLSVEGETNRHNLILEDQGQQALKETARHNLNTEQMQYAHNVVTESIERNRAQSYQGSIEVSQQQADTQSRLADSTIARNEVQNVLDEERTTNVTQQTKESKNRVAQGWVDTITQGLRNIGSAVKEVVDSANVMNFIK